ncbi:MAG: hypothetical protein HY073_05505 [Deltaproteobacteria bacterium]|nr:hypothetical protein [Deltaproteobacteria bacterium]
MRGQFLELLKARQEDGCPRLAEVRALPLTSPIEREARARNAAFLIEALGNILSEPPELTTEIADAAIATYRARFGDAYVDEALRGYRKLGDIEKLEGVPGTPQHWGKKGDYERAASVYVKQGLRVFEGLDYFWDGIDGDISCERTAEDYFGRARHCLQNTAFQSIEDFLIQSASEREAQGRLFEAAALIHDLSAYLLCQRSLSMQYKQDFRDMPLLLGALMEESTLYNMAGDAKKASEAMAQFETLIPKTVPGTQRSL